MATRKDMDHEALAKRIEGRIDKLEDKIVPLIKTATENKKDIAWVKGYIKTSASLIIALAAAVVASIFTK